MLYNILCKQIKSYPNVMHCHWRIIKQCLKGSQVPTASRPGTSAQLGTSGLVPAIFTIKHSEIIEHTQ